MRAYNWWASFAFIRDISMLFHIFASELADS